MECSSSWFSWVAPSSYLHPRRLQRGQRPGYPIQLPLEIKGQGVDYSAPAQNPAVGLPPGGTESSPCSRFSESSEATGGPLFIDPTLDDKIEGFGSVWTPVMNKIFNDQSPLLCLWETIQQRSSMSRNKWSQNSRIYFWRGAPLPAVCSSIFRFHWLAPKKPWSLQ